MKYYLLLFSIFFFGFLFGQVPASQFKKPTMLNASFHSCRKGDANYVLTYTDVNREKDLCTFTITRIGFGDSIKQGTYHISDTTLKDGKFTWWHSSKKKKVELFYVKNVMEGSYTEWNINGAIIKKGNYKNGIKEGEWMVPDKNGFHLVKEFYKNGTALGDFYADTNALAYVTNIQIDSAGKRKYYSGYVNRHGKEVIPVVYASLVEYDEYYFIARKDSLEGIIDKHNNIIVPFQFETISEDRYTDLLRAEKNGKWGYMDLHQNIMIPFMYDAIGYKAEDLIKAKKNGKWGYINAKNEIVIPFKYDIACDFESNQLAHVRIGKEDWLIDKKGTLVRKEKLHYGECEEDIPTEMAVMDRMESNSGETASGTKFRLSPEQDDKTHSWGVKDQNDNWVIEPKYEEIGPYKNGMIRVRLNGKIGYYNDRGELMVDLIYDYGDPFGGY